MLGRPAPAAFRSELFIGGLESPDHSLALARPSNYRAGQLVKELLKMPLAGLTLC